MQKFHHLLKKEDKLDRAKYSINFLMVLSTIFEGLVMDQLNTLLKEKIPDLLSAYRLLWVIEGWKLLWEVHK